MANTFTQIYLQFIFAVDHVVKYIKNQEEHHKLKSFKEEYLDFLKKFAIPYDEKYIFLDVQ